MPDASRIRLSFKGFSKGKPVANHAPRPVHAPLVAQPPAQPQPGGHKEVVTLSDSDAEVEIVSSGSVHRSGVALATPPPPLPWGPSAAARRTQ